MSWSDTLEDAILDHVLGGATYTQVATVWFSLSTTVTADDATNNSEPVGNGYARVGRINNATTFGAAASGVKQNAIAITFPEATGSWGSVLHFSIWANETSETLANLIATGSLGVTKSVTAGDTPRFPINSLSFTQD